MIGAVESRLGGRRERVVGDMPFHSALGRASRSIVHWKLPGIYERNPRKIS